jgi:Uma2 family endonuclease
MAGRWQSRRCVLTDVFVRVGDAFLAPDVAWWSEGREPPIGPGAIAAVPDLVVEVLSPGTRENDLGLKRRRYFDAGVKELWLIDPRERSAAVATRSDDRRPSADDELTSPRLPGLTIAVADLLA